MLRTACTCVLLVASYGIAEADTPTPQGLAFAPTAALTSSHLALLAEESALRLDPPRELTLPTLPRDYLISPSTDGITTDAERTTEIGITTEAGTTTEIGITTEAELVTERPTGAHFGASFGGVLLGAVATGVVVGTAHAFGNDDGRARDLTIAIGAPLLLTAGATWALHRLAEARGEHVRHLPVVVGALLSAGAALAGVFVATTARDEAFVGRHWAWAAPAVALSTGFGAWVAHRLTYGPRRLQPSLGVSPTGVAAHLRVGFRR